MSSSFSEGDTGKIYFLLKAFPFSTFLGLALVVLCSSENEERAHIVTSLEQYKVNMPRLPRSEELRSYLENQFKVPHLRPGLYCEQHVIWSAAAEVGRAQK